MTQPLLLILGIIAMGSLLVVFPVGLATFYRYRRRKVVTCPETHSPAEVRLDAHRAALTTVLGRPRLKVEDCSRWPEKKGCDEECVKENWPEP